MQGISGRIEPLPGCIVGEQSHQMRAINIAKEMAESNALFSWAFFFPCTFLAIATARCRNLTKGYTER